MEIGWLKYFHAVAKEGGYLRASETLSVAQPSISKLVRKLEEELGEKLFEKSGTVKTFEAAGGFFMNFFPCLIGHGLVVFMLEKAGGFFGVLVVLFGLGSAITGTHLLGHPYERFLKRNRFSGAVRL